MTVTIKAVKKQAIVSVVRPNASIKVYGLSVPVSSQPINASYTHNQTTPANTWTINHNLGKKPAIQLLSIGSIEFDANIVHTGINQAIVYLTAPIAGIAQCRA